MTSVNGESAMSVDVAPPPAPASPPATNKRKREDSTSDERNDATALRIKQIQKDLLPVLESHDTTPSLLKHVLPAKEPFQKKAQTAATPDDSTSTIANKLNSASYASLDQIKLDFSDASNAIVSSIRAKERDGPQSGRVSVDELKQIHKVQALEALAKEILDREMGYLHRDEQVVKKEENGTSVLNGAVDRKTGTVLTLFGNAPTPKQLFSSIQTAQPDRKDSPIKLELPVEEMSLPIGVTATKIMATPADHGKKGPTFGDAFAPPHNLAALLPPKAHKRSTTRDNSINWEFKDPVQRNSRKGGYTVQVQTTGAWLGYGGLDASADPTREKRKQRDRALSGGGSLQKFSPDAALDDALAKEEAALFRRAYSSFAPSYDNNGAIVPTRVKDDVWWAKVGEKRFNETFALDPALLDDPPRREEKTEETPLLEEAEMSKVMESLDDLEEASPLPQQVRSKTEVDQVLRQISELLETLASHQRIRNASLPTSGATSRPPISPAPISASKIGKPDEPSEEEISTYNTLRHELAYLILQLPPYAVAKLDGDRLSDLGVSKLITFQTKDTKGTLAEDSVARQAKLSALATASSIANLARPNSSAGQHYSTTSSRTPAIGQAANTRYGQQYATTRTPAPAPQFSRSTSNQSYGTPSGTAQRPAYAPSTQQYARTGAPAPSYNQSNGQQYYQQRAAQQTPGTYGALQQFQQGAQAQRPAYATQQTPQQQYQQRPPNAALAAVNYQTSTPQQQSYARTVSPIKPGGYASPAPQPAQQPPRPTYAPQQQQAPQNPGSGRATPVNYPSQPQTPVNGIQAGTAQRAVAPRPASGTPQPNLQPQAPPPGANGTS
ncbi:unnamed protein product [Zymoseptoria tritici ST99CH_3D7]|uniref:Uncharacterized protein n=1 Tax=Zymoseptoria tritici (strain ST99CH_3D7) TaxID=1276538 RepID=A0A1X7S741_ZYMT9|nr:unnamed protein product [Zymoseptoria tritici ST99CH_3D7]